MLLSSTFHRVKTASTSYKLLMRYGSPIRTFKAHGGPNKAKHQTGAKLCGSKHSIVGRFKERLIRISRPWPEKTITVGRQLGRFALMGTVVLGPAAVACAKMIRTDEPATWEEFSRHMRKVNERILTVFGYLNIFCISMSIIVITYAFRAAFSNIFRQVIRKKRTTTGNEMEAGQGAVTGATAFVLVLMACYGMNLQGDVAPEILNTWPKYVKERIYSTYDQVLGACLVAVAGGILFMGAIITSSEVRKSWRWFNDLFAIMFGTGVVIRSVPRCICFSSKQLGMLDQCGRLDSLVLPLCGIGGQLLLRGTILTSGVLGGLSTIAICGPSEKFFNTEGIFNIAVSAIVMSSLASIFIPPASTLGSIFLAISVFGRWLYLLLGVPAQLRKEEI